MLIRMKTGRISLPPTLTYIDSRTLPLHFCQLSPPPPEAVVRSGQDFHMNCNENPINVVLLWDLRGLSPNFHIHVSVSDLRIPRIGLHIWLQQNRHINPGNK
jgi:hypothetical protein